MFRKIVSHLSFSPSIVGQLGFYAKRLRKEEFTRRIGLIFIALALVVQSFAIFSPPEPAYARDGTDTYLINGPNGQWAVKSVADILRYYDTNQNNYRDIMEYAGITRAELASVQNKRLEWPQANQYMWGFDGGYGGTLTYHDVRDANGNKIPRQVISRPQQEFWPRGYMDERWVGYSAKMGWFAISSACANLITTKMPAPKPAPKASCTALTVTPLSRTRFRLDGKASLENGATTSAHYFIAKDANGKEVQTLAVRGNNTTTQTEMNLKNAGTYTIYLDVHTSVGIVNGNNCIKKVTVAPEVIIKDIQVCDLATKKIITIKENQFNSKKHSKNLDDCKEKVVKYIQVCDLTTKKIITIRDDQFNSRKHSKNLNDCKPPEPKVCTNLSIIKLSGETRQFKASYTDDATKPQKVTYTVLDKNGKVVQTGEKNTFTTETPGVYTVKATVNFPNGDVTGADCQGSFTIPAPRMIKVCDLTTKKIITIKESELNRKKHSTNLKDCVKTVPPCPVNNKIKANDPECQTCPGDKTLWVKDEKCVAQIIKSKTAYNLTTKKNATEAAAKSGEVIEYNLTVQNDGKQEASIDVEDGIRDVLEYADINDFGGGNLSKATGVISWGSVTLQPGEKKTISYSVKIKEKIPAQAQAPGNPNSQDCKITNTFGNTVTTDIDCPAPKMVEQVVQQLPRTGAGANIVGAMVVAAVAVFFYARSRQLNTEVRLIRRDLNAGTI